MKRSTTTLTAWAMAAAATVLAAGGTHAQPALPTRTSLGATVLADPKLVARVETTRVDFRPGQAMPSHKHTVPVFCFVTQGSFLTRIGETPERTAATGTVTFEPPEVLVHYFKNASATSPAQLECVSLAGANDHVLNVMGPQ